MAALVVRGFEVRVPEIADYEVRRELLRANKSKGIARLDLLKNTVRESYEIVGSDCTCLRPYQGRY
jgi:hypothetical protein